MNITNQPKRVFETFMPFGDYQELALTQGNPSVFNGMCRFRKYRVTVEAIDEPIEVLRQRVQDLFDSNDNDHNWNCLQAAAKSLGMGILERTNKGTKI